MSLQPNLYKKLHLCTSQQGLNSCNVFVKKRTSNKKINLLIKKQLRNTPTSKHTQHGEKTATKMFKKCFLKKVSKKLLPLNIPNME